MKELVHSSGHGSRRLRLWRRAAGAVVLLSALSAALLQGVSQAHHPGAPPASSQPAAQRPSAASTVPDAPAVFDAAPAPATGEEAAYNTHGG